MVNMNSLFILTGVIDFKNTVNWLSGYNFNGWLKKQASWSKMHAIKDNTPQYTERFQFCFSKPAFQKAVVKDGNFLV